MSKALISWGKIEALQIKRLIYAQQLEQTFK
jgi:hypothetical protein